MDFDSAFVALIGNEGGLTDDPADPGGLTKYGISQRAYPAVDIRNLTLDGAKAIYRQDYWGPAGCEQVPDAIRFDLFDMAVNSGVKTAIKTLQKAVLENEDGVMGPATMTALQAADPVKLEVRFQGARLLLITSLTTWATFGKGLVERIAHNMLRF